jgi:hypothetical protein
VRARRQRFAGRRRNGLVLRTDLDEQWNAGSVRDGGARRGRSAGPGSVRKLTIAVIGDRDRKRRPYVEAEGRRRRRCVRVLNDCRENRRSNARSVRSIAHGRTTASRDRLARRAGHVLASCARRSASDSSTLNAATDSYRRSAMRIPIRISVEPKVVPKTKSLRCRRYRGK